MRDPIGQMTNSMAKDDKEKLSPSFTHYQNIYKLAPKHQFVQTYTDSY